MIVQILFAAILSLTSTNDYVYFTSFPTNADIRGVGMGAEGLYSMPRFEDAAFLTEAWAERMEAVHGNDDQIIKGNYTPKHLLNSSFSMTGSESNYVGGLNYMFPESFDQPYWHIHRGSSPSFVSSSFDFGSSSGGYQFCTTNWLIDGYVSDINYSLRDSYYCFINSGYQRLVPPDLSTNAIAKTRSLLKKSYTQCLYTNLAHTGHIVSAGDAFNDYLQINQTYCEYRGITTKGSSGQTKISVNQVLNNPTYTYTEYEYNHGNRARYASGYSLETIPTTQENYQSTVLPLPSFSFLHQTTTRTPFVRKFTDSPSTDPRKYTSFATELTPYLYSVRNRVMSPYQWTPIRVYCENITTGSVDKCSNIKAYLMLGIRRKLAQKHYYDIYEGHTPVTTSAVIRTEHDCVFASRRLTISQTSDTIVENGIPYVVFDTTKSLQDEIQDAISFFGDNNLLNYSVPPIYADSSVIPRDTYQMDFILNVYNLNAINEVTIDYLCEWAKVIFIFDRDYRAKVVQ